MRHEKYVVLSFNDDAYRWIANSVLVVESSKSVCKTHEITLLKIKHIRLREKYGEGEYHMKQQEVAQFFLNNINW